MRPLVRVCSLFFLAGLSACQSDSATQQRAAPPAGQVSITIEGRGSTVTRRVGSGLCANSHSGSTVSVSISSGKAGNSIKGDAFCGGVLQATATAKDPGGGPAAGAKGTGPIVAGQPASCGHTYTGAAPDSNWLVSCDFK